MGVKAVSFTGYNDCNYVYLVEGYGLPNNPLYIIKRKPKDPFDYMNRLFIAFVVDALMSCGKDFYHTREYIDSWLQ